MASKVIYHIIDLVAAGFLNKQLGSIYMYML